MNRLSLMPSPVTCVRLWLPFAGMIAGLLASRVDFVAADMPLANTFPIHILAAVAFRASTAGIKCRILSASA
jgi:hypothetical protein